MKIFSRILFVFMAALALAGVGQQAQAQSSLSGTKLFSPDTIAPGSSSLLTITINNSNASPATDIAFTDAFPTGLTIAGSGASTTCDLGAAGAALTAADGANTVTLANARLAASSSCTVTVNVTSSTPGIVSNTISTIASNFPSSSSFSDDLTVDSTFPSFTKTFSPVSIGIGGTSRMEYTVDNTGNADQAAAQTFTDTLPTGLTIASPSNASTTCTAATFSPTAGGTTINSINGFVLAGSTCTYAVDVTSSVAGVYTSTSGNFTSGPFFPTDDSGSATAELTVTGAPAGSVQITKSFGANPVSAGGTTTITFDLQNRDRNFSATNVTFSDDLNAFITGAAVASTPSNSCGGTVTGTSTATLSGATIPAGSICQISFDVSIPGGTGTGQYTNTTTAVTADINGASTTGNVASATLNVEAAADAGPSLTVSFADSVPGGSMVASFVFTNNSANALTNGTFQMPFSVPLPDTTTLTPPAAGFCGAGSSMSTPLDGGTRSLLVSGSNLAGSADCSFDVTFNLPIDTTGGTYDFTTNGPSGTVNGATRTGPPASGSAVVNANMDVTLAKSFTPSSVETGGTTTLEFTITNALNSPLDAAAMAFSDDLNAMLAGTTATGLPLSNICGTGSSLTGSAGDTLLTFADGTLAPGSSCTFSVTVQVPAGVTSETTRTNTTSNLAGNAGSGGAAFVAGPASADLTIRPVDENPVTLTKSFTDDPALPGGTTTLEFTISNPNTTNSATGIFFTDSLTTMLSGAVSSAGTLNDVCGSGSSISGTNFLIFVGGNLAPGADCTFSVPVDIPGAAAQGDYNNVTSSITATVGSSTTVGDPATDALSVYRAPLNVTKTMTATPVNAGSTADLTITIENLSNVALTDLEFADTLQDMIAGTSVVSTTTNDCNGSVSLAGNNIAYSAGSLAANATCTYAVSLLIPAATGSGTYTNTVNSVQAVADGITVTGNDDTADLTVVGASDVAFSKAFGAASVITGESVSLTFTLDNEGTSSVSGLRFSDDLSAMVSGATISAVPAAPCGAASVSGSGSLLTVSGLTLAANGVTGEICTFDVTVNIPAGATAGTVTNTTSALTDGANTIAQPATASVLLVEPTADLTMSITDATDPMLPGGTQVYTVQVNNAGPQAAESVVTTFTLPAGMTLTSSSGCAEDPSGAPTCSLGDIPSGGNDSFTVTASLSSTAVGSLNASGSVTSSTTDPTPGNNTASQTTTVTPVAELSITKTDGVTSVNSGASVTYTIVASNAGPATDSSVSVTDTFPSDLTCSYTSVAAGGATGNTAAGSGDLAETLSMPSGSSVTYTASCDVDFNASGTLSNTATISGSELDQVAGDDTATDTTSIVSSPPPTFTKTFSTADGVQGLTATMNIAINNTAAVALSGLNFTDDLGAMLTGATAGTLPATPCGAGSALSQSGGVISFSGGSLAASASCNFNIDVNIPVTAPLGTATNTTSSLSNASSVLTAGASDTINIIAPAADLSVTLADSADPVQPTDTLTYTVNVSNAGPQDAATVVSSLPLPTGFTLTSTTGCAEDPNGAPTCNLGTITSGGNASYTVTGTIDNLATADLSATATVSSATADPDSSNNSATEATVLNPVADLAITKTDGVTTTIGGDTLNYTIVASNNGPSNEASATVSDTIQSDMTCDYTSVASGGATGNTATGSGDLSETLALPVGSSVTYSMSCVVDFDFVGVITNTATIAGTELDTTSGNNSATDTTTISMAPVPTFTKSFLPTSVVQGFDTVMTIAITNNASVPLNGLTFSDDIDGWISGATLGTLPSDPCGTGSTLTNSGGVLTMAGGVLTASGGATPACSFDVTITIPTTAPLGDALNTTSNLSNGSTDLVAPASATLEVTAPMADISVAISDDADPVLPGGTLVYTVDVANAGPQDATGVVSTFTLPSNVTFVSTSGCAEDPSGNPTCTLGSIASGGSTSYTITGTVSDTAVGALSASASVNSPVADPDSSNNSDTESTSVTAVVDVSVTKTDGVTAITAGDSLTYTIVAANAGPATDSDVFLTDILPAELTCTYTSVVSGGVTGNTATGSGDLVETLVMPAGSSATYTLDCLVDISFAGTLSNTADIFASEIDSDASNDSATDDDTVVSAPSPLVWSQVFTPSTIDQGTTSTLQFTIDNSANVIDATSVAFTNNLPSGMQVASPAGASNTCGATFSPAATDTTLSMSAGTVTAGSTCTVTVDVQATAFGSLVNTTGALSSNFPADSAAISATLNVNEVPLNVVMSFTPSTISQFETSTLTYGLTNPAVISATSISLSDTLPSNVTIASPANITNTCSGGTVAAGAGGTSFAYTGGSLVAGGRCVLSVDVTSSIAGTYANTTESVTANTGTSAAASASLQVDSATTGQVTFVQESDTDGSYSFDSANTALTFLIEVSAGTGQQGPVTVEAGSYSVVATPPNGVALTAISCDDSNSTGDPTSRTLSLNVSALENVTCTFTAQSATQKTVDTINKFLTKRADLILSSEPSLSRRIDRLNRGFGNASPLTFSNGDLKSFLPFTAEISRGSNNYRFSTSLLQIRQAAASVELAHGSTKDAVFVDNYRFDAWFEAQYKEFDTGADGEGHFAIAHFGVDYLLNKNVLIGAMFQIDDMEDKSAANNTTASGTGWMVGPYITARLAPRLYFDARIAAGASKNSVSPFNTYSNDFDTQRWMAVASLSGEFDKGPWTIRPNASLSYFGETQDSYVDATNGVIPSQTIHLGQLKIGPTFTGHFEGNNGEIFAPYLSLDAIYNLGSTTGVTLTDPTSASTDGWRARLKAGINMTTEDGISIGFGGTYDGIGRDDFEAWGLTFDLSIPLKKAKAE